MYCKAYTALKPNRAIKTTKTIHVCAIFGSVIRHRIQKKNINGEKHNNNYTKEYWSCGKMVRLVTKRAHSALLTSHC